MKVTAKVVEVEGEGFVSLLDTNIEIYTIDYIYAGKLVGVNDTCVKLEDPHIVYETGEFSAKKYKDCQSMCKPEHYIQISAIISFGETTRI